jgi:hypothetical protein
MKIIFTIFTLIFWIVVANMFIFEKSCAKKSVDNPNIQNQKKVETMTTSQSQIRWIPGTYKGLKIGESSYKDVKKTFGKPRWEGDNEDKTFESDTEFETLLQYPKVGEENMALEAIIGKETKTLKAITLLPNFEMTKEEAISKYGSDYFEIASGDSLCIEENFKRGHSEKKMSFPILLVYPEKGMTISIGEDNKIILISLLYKCTE